MLGRPGGWPRDPIKPLDDDGRRQIRSVLVSMGLMRAEDARRATA
jgi:hypothetical protein